MPVPASSACVLRFDIFELDLRASELRKRGVKLRLQGQPVQVLAVLLKRSGELVTRDELRAQIWPGDTFVDFDHSLHNSIARIREALGDSAGNPRYIETLPRRGYRFIAPVELVGSEVSSVAEQSELSAQTRISEQSSELVKASSFSMPSKTRAAVAITFLTLVVLGLALWLVPTLTHSNTTGLPLRSIAVLPLENLSGDVSQDYFVDGMTEELITDLAKVSALRVTSRTSVMRYKGTKKSLPEIARELNVDGVVEGSVTRSGNRIRVTAQLLNAPTDQHLWAETYDRDLGDVLSLQSEVAQTIARQVRAQVTPEQEARLRVAAHSVNPEAFEAYLRGRYYLTTEFSRGRELQKARHYFEEAIAKDPNFALAYSGLADSYAYLAFFRQLPPEVGYRSAKEAVHKALELDDSIGEAHDTLAMLSWRYEWDWESAEREFDKAIALAPSYSCAHEDRSEYLGMHGHRSEALAELAKSIEMDPSPSSALTEAGTYYQLRDYVHLVDSSRRGIVSNPSEWLEHYYLGIGYEGMGKRLEAISEYQKAIEISGGDQDAIASLAHAYAVIGKKSETRKILSDLERNSTNSYVSPYLIAAIYASLDQNDKAFEFLEKAYRERSLELSWSIKSDLRIDGLRSDPRFQKLMERVGLDAETILPK
jgi:TolB-like protein/DNA-binding winged helix-turn-helix (wHTH) protein/Flp pilus assembly protein TadD